MSCNQNCQQGRRCTCAPHQPSGRAAGALILAAYVASFAACVAALFGGIAR